MRAVLLSGSGRYADPWHPFDRTSAVIGELLEEAGYVVEVPEDVDAALAEFTDPTALPDLLAVNVGLPRDETPTPAAGGATDGLQAALASVPLLAFHVSSTSFIDSSDWARMLGGRWVRGTTMHPDRGRALVRVVEDGHPITTGLVDFEVDDERYSFLEVGTASVVLLEHELDGARHPLAWCAPNVAYELAVRRAIAWLGAQR